MRQSKDLSSTLGSKHLFLDEKGLSSLLENGSILFKINDEDVYVHVVEDTNKSVEQYNDDATIEVITMPNPLVAIVGNNILVK